MLSPVRIIFIREIVTFGHVRMYMLWNILSSRVFGGREFVVYVRRYVQGMHAVRCWACEGMYSGSNGPWPKSEIRKPIGGPGLYDKENAGEGAGLAGRR